MGWASRWGSILVVVCLAAGVRGAGADSVERVSPFGNPWYMVTIQEATILTEVVATPTKIFQGLSGRRELPAGTGMLFVLPHREVQHFCMRGMLLPLDFIWIKGDRVAGVTTNIAASDPRTISSPEPVEKVLEVPAGFCEAHGIVPGARVTMRARP